MSEELEINGEQFLPSKVAAKQVGYTGDYVARLAREEKVRARKIGKTWFVSTDSLTSFAEQAETQKEHTRRKLSEERKRELKTPTKKTSTKKNDRDSASARKVYIPKLFGSTRSLEEQPSAVGKTHALAETLTVLMLGIFFGTGGYLISSSAVAGSTPSGVAFLESLAISVYETLTPLEEERAPGDATLADQSPATDADDTVQAEHVEDVRVARSETASTTTNEADGQLRDEEVDQQRMETEAERAIRDSFSDEVEVAFDNDRPNAAVVFPVFADGRGEPYEFVIMPMPKQESVGVRQDGKSVRTASSSAGNEAQN